MRDDRYPVIVRSCRDAAGGRQAADDTGAGLGDVKGVCVEEAIELGGCVTLTARYRYVERLTEVGVARDVFGPHGLFEPLHS